VDRACGKSSVSTPQQPTQGSSARPPRHPAAALSRYAAGMTLGLTLLQTEVTRALPIPAWGFGVIAFGILTILLLITWSIGKGRPHS
jgi:hypothetical protein